MRLTGLWFNKVQEMNNIFEEISPEEYERIQNERRQDDFIVDDEGFGYKDEGGEIWENYEKADAAKKSKKRKLNVSENCSVLSSLPVQKDEQSIQTFMYPVSAI